MYIERKYSKAVRYIFDFTREKTDKYCSTRIGVTMWSSTYGLKGQFVRLSVTFYFVLFFSHFKAKNGKHYVRGKTDHVVWRFSTTFWIEDKTNST